MINEEIREPLFFGLKMINGEIKETRRTLVGG